MSARALASLARAWLLAGAAVTIGGCLSAPTTPETVRGGTVTYVTDGDTLRVEQDGNDERVRLLGIDTPEVARPGEVGECGAAQAASLMRRLAPPGARVGLRGDASQDQRDRYGRRLAYVSSRGRDAGAELVAAGWAAPYTYRGRPVERARQYRELASTARRERRGVWARCPEGFGLDQ